MTERSHRRFGPACALIACALMMLGRPQFVSAQACGKGPPEPPPPPEPSVRLGLGLAMGVLNLPNLGAGLSAIAQLGSELPIDVSLAYFFENTEELTDSQRDLELLPRVPGFAHTPTPFPPGGSRIAYSIAQANLGMCPVRHELSPGVLLGCAGAYGGFLTAEAEGFIERIDVLRVVFGLEAYARWRYPLAGPIGLTYSAGLFVPLLRPGFGYVTSEGKYREQFRPSSLGGRLDIALTYAIP